MSRLVMTNDLFIIALIEKFNSHFSIIDKFGFNDTIGTTYEDVWTVSSNITYMTSASTLTLVSSSTSDVSTSTGAHTITIQGLDGDFLEVEESINLNGTTNVTTANSYIRVYRMLVTAAGSNGSNVGTIQIKDGADVQAEIGVGYNQTLMTQYTVPAGKNAYFRQIHINAGKSADAEARLMVRSSGEVFQVKFLAKAYQSDIFHDDFRVALKVTEKSDIKIQAKTSAGTQEVAAGYQIILMDNTLTFDIPIHLS